MHRRGRLRWGRLRPSPPEPRLPAPATEADASRRTREKKKPATLLLSCATCDRTSKVPVHERAHVSTLEPVRLVAYEINDPAEPGRGAPRSPTGSRQVAAGSGQTAKARPTPGSEKVGMRGRRTR
ncbi:DUF1062 domain-containing protein [Kitasatospora sp. NPDC092039]|uniref:DUF1062 domain-containing protein n=1 Tax=Kitasatospora sp. NPDC092039 TaxID=3364086 RepID=UPI0038295259